MPNELIRRYLAGDFTLMPMCGDRFTVGLMDVLPPRMRWAHRFFEPLTVGSRCAVAEDEVLRPQR